MDHGLARGLTNYGDRDFALYLRRSFARSMGYSTASLAKPVVGIADSGSGFNNCHRHFPELIDAVKRGVLAAGGLPVDFPTISLGEVFLEPTSTTASIGWARIISSTSMDMRLRNIMLVGDRNTSPSEIVGKSSGRPPAATTPRLTASISSGKWRWQLLNPLADWAIPTTGRASISRE